MFWCSGKYEVSLLLPLLPGSLTWGPGTSSGQIEFVFIQLL